MKLSGLEWTAIGPCYRWMEPYFHVILQQPKLCLQERNEQIETKLGVSSVCPNIVTDDSHIIQMHTTSMDMFVSTVGLPSTIFCDYIEHFAEQKTKIVYFFRQTGSSSTLSRAMSARGFTGTNAYEHRSCVRTRRFANTARF